MSELVKSFVFDLQRFTEQAISAAVQLNKVSLQSAAPTATVGSSTTNYYWAETLGAAVVDSKKGAHILGGKYDTVDNKASGASAGATINVITTVTSATLASDAYFTKLPDVITLSGGSSGFGSKKLTIPGGMTFAFAGTGTKDSYQYSSSAADTLAFEAGTVSLGAVAKASTEADGLVIGTNAYQINKAAVYNVTSKQVSLTTADANKASVTAAGEATMLALGSNSITDLTIGETGYKVSLQSGTKSSFVLDSTKGGGEDYATGFYFGKAKDAISLGGGAETLAFTYGDTSSPATLGATFDLGTAETGILQYTNATNKKQQFNITGLGAEAGVTLDSKLNFNSIAGNSVSLDAANTVIAGFTITKTNGAATLAAGSGNAATLGVAVNSSLVDNDVTGTTKNAFQYFYNKSKGDTVIFTKEVTTGASVLAGDAKYVAGLDKYKAGLVIGGNYYGTTITPSGGGTVASLPGDASVAGAYLQLGSATQSTLFVTGESGVVSVGNGKTPTAPSGVYEINFESTSTNGKTAIAMNNGAISNVVIKDASIEDGASISATFASVGAADFASAQTITIDSAAVTADKAFTYSYIKDTGNSEISFADTLTGAVNLTKTGAANIVRGPESTVLGEGSVSLGIGTATYNYIGGGEDGAYFKVANNSVTGFVFTSEESGIRVPANGTAPNLYYLADDTETQIKSGYSVKSGAYYDITSADGSVFNITFMGGEDFATPTSATIGGVGFDFSSIASASVTAAFGVNDGKATLDATGISFGDGSAFEIGDAVAVTGATSKNLGDAEGLVINGSPISVASGNFTYKVEDVGGTATNALVLNSDDTVVTAGDTTTRVYATDATKVTFGAEDSALTYEFTDSDGDAFFHVETNAVKGFHFGDAGDAIVMPAGADPFESITYGDGAEPLEFKTEAVPTVDNGDKAYTITATAIDATKETAAFEISGLVANATAELGDANFTFDSVEAAGKIAFDADGVTGVTFTSGVEFTGVDTAKEGRPFSINGEQVSIAGATDANWALTKDGDDIVLSGFDGGETVYDSGLITKIMAGELADSITFGAGDSEKTFTVTTGTDSEAYFKMTDGAVDGFVFSAVEDAITGNLTDFNLYADADSEAFAAPKVYETKGGEVRETTTVTKTANGFAISGFAKDNYVELTDAKLTFTNVASDEDNPLSIEFDGKGNLIGITAPTEADAVKVAGATQAITFYMGEDDETGKKVEITGSSFVFTQGAEGATPTISEVTGNATIKQVAGASLVSSATDSLAAGTFTFADGKTFTLAGEDIDGVDFIVNSSVGLSGINSITGSESVTGALNGLSFNDAATKLQLGSASNYVVFNNEDGNLALDGMANGDSLVATGGISDFSTAEEGTFNLFGAEYTTETDKDVTFNTDGTALTGISSLESGTVIGSFSAAEGLEVNGENVKVTNDDKVAVTADADGNITKVAQLGVDDAVTSIEVQAGSASVFGVDKNGAFDFNSMGSFSVANNGTEETVFDFSEGQVITGVDATEVLSGDFSSETSVDGKMLEVTNDENISLVGGKQILGLAAGADVAQAEGISSAKTVEEAFEGTITFGQSSFEVTSKDGVEFLLDGKGAVIGISGIGEGEKVVGNLNDVIINGKDPVISVVGANGSPNTELTYENGTLSGVKDGDTVYLADNVTKIVTAGGEVTFKAPDGDQKFYSDDDSLTFAVTSSTDGVKATAITDLDAEKFLEGAIMGLSVNGKTVDIANDTELGVIGADDGISTVYKLSDGAVVVDAAGATLAGTDTEGTFTFGGQSFTTAGDSTVHFTLNDKNAVTAIAGLSSGAVIGNFDDITTVNDQKFEVLNDTEIAVFAGADGKLSQISKVTGGASIGEIGSVSQVITDGEGVFTFTKGEQEFTTSDGATVVTFGTEESKVTSISDLNGAVTGSFSGITVNDAAIDITDKDGVLKVTGDGTKLTAIEDVTADATINAAGGVSSLAVDIPETTGMVTFGDGKEFIISGDSAVTFGLDKDAAATSVTELNGVISGALSGLTSVNGKTFKVAADNEFSVYGTADASDIAKLANISGGASIGQVGSVSQVLTDTAGTFTFTNGSWDVAGDSAITFGLKDSKVTSISDLDGTVSGAFNDVTVNDAAVAISGDSAIAIVAGASGITEIQNLSGSAVIGVLDGTVKATTDSEGLFTFADGQAVSISGDSEVVFNLVDGKLQSIDELAETATLSGDLNGVSIVGASAAISVEAGNKNLQYTTGTLSGVANGNTVYGAAEAETVKVVTNGAYTFANGTFSIDGDQNGTADFVIAKGTNSVLAIDDVDTGATVNGPLNGLSINGGEALNVIGDDDFGAVAGDGTLAKLVNLSDGANVSVAGGASQFVTNEEGNFTILGTAMGIENDNGVTFTGGGTSGITAIDELNGTATGDFTGGIAVNGAENVVQVSGDSSVAVTSEGDVVTRIADVTGSNAPTVVSTGGATEVGTNAEGTFTFGGASQVFTTTGDNEVTFNLDDEGVVTGVSEFDEDGTLSFKDVEALTVNDNELTISSTQNVSLSIAESAVNYVQGVDDAIGGLENATVVATGSMTVNDVDIAVEGDNDYKVIVEDGEVVALADVGNENGVTVNVAAPVSIGVVSNGNVEIGSNAYNFEDILDGAYNLVTNDEGELASVDSFLGEMVIAEPGSQSLNVNGSALSFSSTTDSVTVASDLIAITSIKGLANKDGVFGDLGGASIAMAPEGTDASVKGEGEFLTVNDVTYQLLNDADGVSVNGSRQVVDLDEEASLYPDQKGTYVVNGATLEVEDTTYPIIGLDNATDAYIYDPANLIIRKGTPVSSIEEMLGLPTDTLVGYGTEDSPLSASEVDALFGASSTADFDQPLEIFATNDEKATQYIPLAGSDFRKKVHLYDGNQTVTFNNAGGNLAIVRDTNAAGDPISGVKDITLGDMGDAVIMKADAGNGTYVDITGGTGNDSVVVQGSAPVNFDMSEGGADKLLTFASSGARVSLKGYDALKNPNAGVQITETWTSDLADAITNGWLSFANGIMSLLGKDATGSAQVNLGTNLVNLFNYKGIKQAVGFTPDEGGLVDGSAAQDPLILIGNNKDQKSGKSTLLGGSGDDTAIAGGGDSIDLGLGNNEVRLQDNKNRAGADITLTRGRTTITGFNTTFNLDHGDIISTDLSGADISFDGDNVYIAGTGFYGVIAGASVDGAISYDSANVTESADLVESADSSSASVMGTSAGDYTNVMFEDEGVISKTAIAKDGGVIDVKLDSDMRANNYIGDNSGLTFYDLTGEVLVNLTEGTGSIDAAAVNYSGINKVAAGAGQTTIIGGESNETMIAGQGNDSVWGAGGKNLLFGYNDVNGDKTGQTSFFVVAEANGAANTIRGFEFVDDDNYNLNTNKITADVLDIQVQYDRIDVENGGVSLDGDNVVLFVNNRSKNSSESVIIEGARGKDFIVSGNGIIDNVIAQVNTDSLVADKFANFFVATGKNATLTVSNDIDTANIYLGGTPLFTDFDGKAAEFYGDIHVIDATGSHAKAELGGNIYDNVIMAGSGDSTLWGGDGGNDLLVAGSGKNTFSYNYGNGNDTVNGAKDGDVIDLTNIFLEDIVDVNDAITSTGVEFKFTDGNTLTVNSTANVEFQVGGETYIVNEDRDGWTKKA